MGGCKGKRISLPYTESGTGLAQKSRENGKEDGKWPQACNDRKMATEMENWETKGQNPILGSMFPFGLPFFGHFRPGAIFHFSYISLWYLCVYIATSIANLTTVSEKLPWSQSLRGWYIVDAEAPSAIAPCPEGHECPQAGTVYPQPCSPGTYAKERGQDECKLCPEGRYQNAKRASNCTSCETVLTLVRREFKGQTE